VLVAHIEIDVLRDLVDEATQDVGRRRVGERVVGQEGMGAEGRGGPENEDRRQCRGEK